MLMWFAAARNEVCLLRELLFPFSVPPIPPFKYPQTSYLPPTGAEYTANASVLSEYCAWTGQRAQCGLARGVGSIVVAGKGGQREDGESGKGGCHGPREGKGQGQEEGELCVKEGYSEVADVDWIAWRFGNKFGSGTMEHYTL